MKRAMMLGLGIIVVLTGACREGKDKFSPARKIFIGGDKPKKPEKEEQISDIKTADSDSPSCDNPDDVKETELNLEFPVTEAACPWGTDDNLAMLGRHLQARIEQRVVANFPENTAKVCNFGLSFPDQEILYDDQIIMTFNNFLLFGSLDFPARSNLEGKDQLFSYSWERIRGTAFEPASVPAPIFCVGGEGNCELPESQSSGKFAVTLTTELVQAMLADVAPEENFFEFIAMGDNDPASDCRHSPIEFTVKLEYLEK